MPQSGSWLRRRTSFEWAVLGLWFSRALLGWVVSLPLIRLFEESGIGALPGGDRHLFEPGALWLVELLRGSFGAIAAAVKSALALGSLAILVLSVPTALVFVAAAQPTEDLGTLLLRCVRLVPRFLATALLEAVAALLFLGLSVFLALSLPALLPVSTTEPTQDLLALGLVGLGLLATGVARGLGETMRALLASSPRSLASALAEALRVLREQRSPLISGYVLACGAGLLLLALAARVAELSQLERPGAWRFWLVFASCQSSLLGLVLLKAWWVQRVSACARLGSPSTQR